MKLSILIGAIVGLGVVVSSAQELPRVRDMTKAPAVQLPPRAPADEHFQVREVDVAPKPKPILKPAPAVAEEVKPDKPTDSIVELEAIRGELRLLGESANPSRIQQIEERLADLERRLSRLEKRSGKAAR